MYVQTFSCKDPKQFAKIDEHFTDRENETSSHVICMGLLVQIILQDSA